jgi:ABC-type nitrate/sulfonate/bicarbonate transport system permease component
MNETALRWLRHAIGLIGLVVIWEIGGRRVGDALLAPPSMVLPDFIAMFEDPALLATVAGSLRQMVAGYALALLAGVPVGIAMGRLRLLEVVLYPWLSMLIVTSIASLIPLFILAVGTGFQFRLLVVFVSAVFYVAMIAYEGARDVERRWLDVGRSFSATPLQRFRLIIVPALFPHLLTAARIGLGQALRGMVIAELFVIIGIGGLIHNAGQELSTARNFALLVLLMTIALVANELLRWAASRLAPWYEASRKVS